MRWRELVDSDGLPQKSKAALDRMRDLLFFRGSEEVIPFLELIVSEMTNGDITPRGDQTTKSTVASSPRFNKPTTEYLFDSLGVERLLTNFPFRGSRISTPVLLWNSAV